MKKHPSGRPVSKDTAQKTLPIQRIPNEGPLTPGLRRQELQPAIGFTVGPYEEYDEWEDE